MGEMRREVRVMLGSSIHRGAESEALGVAFCFFWHTVICGEAQWHSVCVSVTAGEIGCWVSNKRAGPIMHDS